MHVDAEEAAGRVNEGANCFANDFQTPYALPMSTVVADHPADRILDPVVRSLTPEVAERILAVTIEQSLQDRVNILAARASAGTLTPVERLEYERIVEQADLLGIVKSLARRSLAG